MVSFMAGRIAATEIKRKVSRKDVETQREPPERRLQQFSPFLCVSA
jgi:hypothetical protein